MKNINLVIVESTIELPMIWVYIEQIYYFSNYRVIYDKSTFRRINLLLLIMDSVFVIGFYYINKSEYVTVPLTSLATAMAVFCLAVILLILNRKQMARIENTADIDKNVFKDQLEMQSLNNKRRDSNFDLKHQTTERTHEENNKVVQFKPLYGKANKAELIKRVNEHTDPMEVIKKITGKMPEVVSYNQNEVLDINEIDLNDKSNTIIQDNNNS